MKKIVYCKKSDYYIPSLHLKNSTRKNFNIGKYGLLRLNYLKNYKHSLYSQLSLTGNLSNHLIDIDKTANKKISQIINELTTTECINETLKENNHLQWTQAMNNIKNRAEEIVINELIYV